MAVASPAPAAPIFIYCGRMKNGSNTMFSTPPSVTPAKASAARPSARSRLDSSRFSIVPAPPHSSVQRA